MSDEGRLVAGRYRVIQRIGTGAMGAVWQAQDEVLHRTVAIKQLLLQPGLDENEAEDARQRTMREGRIAARLHHPNAITVFDVVTDENGQPCLIMEYLASTSLAASLQERRTLPPLEVARIGAQIAAALKEAHAVGIVHRDIKPGNILLAPNGMVKITDFGISRATDDVTVTKTGMIAGTPAYLAPEVAIGGDPGPESDVFSLGSTLYAACEGQPPFGLSENTLSLLHAVAAGQINPPRQSGPLASVLAVLLHPDTRHRPTAEECEDLLSAVARGETPIGGSAADATRVGPAVGLGAAAVGAGAAGAALADGDDELPDNHSGTLGDEGVQGFYGTEPEDGYAPGTGYPDEDFDNSAAGLDATRAVPAAGAAYGAGGVDGYGGEYGEYEDDDFPPPAEEQERRGNWKVPAAIGGVVAAGLVALGVWIATGPHAGEGPEPAQQPLPAATTSSPSSTMTSTTTSEPSSEETESVQAPVETVRQTEAPRQTQAPQPPPPTSEPEPEPEPTDETTPTEPSSSTKPSQSEPAEPTGPPSTSSGGGGGSSDTTT
ncbi:serine/threonine-protein kinase [Amycolatopsis palatopharyngis]|uniref:serine/threonine-protein kinase n=1 Tax=Amycolatopsis palatopharyngis TaxID=187982 RepID=UPI000E232F2C|nr:serine/threonine-protein kinase [Amycolatopsis palatopharyngis]